MGPFYVLVGAHMPAVLVECGFMSNAAEAARLGSPRYQDVLAGATATAVAHYLDGDLAAGDL
jgi:N-acetylmuramoyl-L-alanine amidase